MSKSIKVFPLVILLAFLSVKGQDETKKISIAVHWQPQAQFAGYYIGAEKGIYEKHGLDVKIVHASPNVTSQEMLLEGMVDYASMFLSTAMFLRSGDHSLVNVCQLSQKCAQMFVSKKSAGLTKPSDFNNKSIGIWRSGFDEIPYAFVQEYNLNVEFVLINSTTTMFLYDGIDAITTMWYNEYHSILNSGYNPDEINIVFFADHDLDIPEDGIYCLEENYNKDITDRFVKATLEAWQYAFNHEEEALNCVERIMRGNKFAFNKAHQRWMFNRMNDLYNVKGKEYKPGQLLKKDFEKAQDIFTALERLNKKIDYNKFYYGIK